MPLLARDTLPGTDQASAELGRLIQEVLLRARSLRFGQQLSRLRLPDGSLHREVSDLNVFLQLKDLLHDPELPLSVVVTPSKRKVGG